MDLTSILFYFMAFGILLFSMSVLFHPNPVMCSIFLALTMVTLSGLFFLLQAYFIAGVQLAVYAGAVVVLFVMVLMLFDLGQETESFTRGALTGFLKWLSSGVFAGIVTFAVVYSTDMIMLQPSAFEKETAMSTHAMAKLLFTDYIVAFEVLGLLLLLVAIGAVVISRIKGGTHADK